ncbi:hypothetical protein, partial [Rhodopseudomonas sp. B29]|uniref:hypothetical protein n=1 Tax=Rhodopseudomonas sp. B29 TaxID=95607 RepID=UPI0011D1D389
MSDNPAPRAEGAPRAGWLAITVELENQRDRYAHWRDRLAAEADAASDASDRDHGGRCSNDRARLVAIYETILTLIER